MSDSFRKTVFAVLGVGFVAMAATGCTSDGEGMPSTSPSQVISSAPAASADSGEGAAKSSALEAYRGMWADMVTAGRTSDHKSPLLARHATGNALKQIVQSLYLDAQDGAVGRGEPVLDPRVGSVDIKKQPARVVIEDCADSTNWTLQDAKTGKPVGTPGGRRHISADVRGVDGSWKVVDFRVRKIGSC